MNVGYDVANDGESNGWGDFRIAVNAQDLPPEAAMTLSAERLIDATRLIASDVPLPMPKRDAWAQSAAEWLALSATRTLGCDRAGIALLGPQVDQFMELAQAGVSPEEVRDWWATAQGSVSGKVHAMQGIRRLQAGEIVFRDIPHSWLSRPSPSVTMLIVPMMAVGIDLVGVLVIEHHDRAHLESIVSGARALAMMSAQVLTFEQLSREHAEWQHQLAARIDDPQLHALISQTCHELKNPLATLKISVQIAKRRLEGKANVEPFSDKTNRSVSDLLDVADRHVNIENRLITDLLDMTRIETQQLKLEIVPCDLSTVMRQAIDEHLFLWPAREVNLSVPDEEVLVEADPMRVAQVVTNYLTNALKYSPPDRPVEVHIDRERRFVRVSVRDYGTGIPKQELKRIWKRFYRVPGMEVTSGTSAGLGLGLYICQTIIQRHHGRVGARSSPGKGSTFWFTLPLKKGS